MFYLREIRGGGVGGKGAQAGMQKVELKWI